MQGQLLPLAPLCAEAGFKEGTEGKFLWGNTLILKSENSLLPNVAKFEEVIVLGVPQY